MVPPLLTKLGVWTDLNKYMGTFEEIQFVFSEEIQFVFFWTKSCFQTAPNQPVRGGGQFSWLWYYSDGHVGMRPHLYQSGTTAESLDPAPYIIHHTLCGGGNGWLAGTTCANGC